MPFTTIYKRGDIVLVPFPFTDLRDAKQRPALVISPDALNFVRDDLLLAGITSQIPTTLASDEFLIPQKELAACGLPKPSVVKLVKLVALHRSLIIKDIGSMPEPILTELLARIRACFE